MKAGSGVLAMCYRIIMIFLLSFSAVLYAADEESAVHYHAFQIEDKRFKAIAVSPDKVSLHWKNPQTNTPYRYFSKLNKALTKQGKSAVILMNAGIYSANDDPAGLHIEKNNVLKSLNQNSGKGNFHLQPNGVFFITQQGKADILTTSAYRKRYGKQHQTVRLATQSGPMLLIDGKINRKFLPKSSSAYTRNAVCITPKGKLFFVLAESPTNLYTFALANQQLGCHQALYLDGSISKLYVRGENTTFHFSHFVGILAVTE